MRVIDVCESFSGGKRLERYYQENNINNYKIVYMGMVLSVGDIKNDHLSSLRTIYGEDIDDYNESINELLNNLDNSKFRIWSSKKSDADYLLLLYLCNLLKDKSDCLSVIYTTDYDKYVDSIGSLDYKEFEKVLEYEKELSMEDINRFSHEWEEIVRVNSDLRVLEDGVVKNKSYSDYDEIILNKLGELGPCTKVNLVVNLMIGHTINNSSDAVYKYLVDRLISQGKIIIKEKGKSSFYDFIEKR